MIITLKFHQVLQRFKKRNNYYFPISLQMSFDTKPLVFTILRECQTTKARVSKMLLPHGEVDTPVFMPVGTQVK